MKITNVEATWLRYQIPEAGQHTSDFGKLTTFDMTLVRVETDAGLTGHGEAKAAVGSAGINAPVVSVVNDELPPLLVGQDPRDIAGLWERMYNGVRAHYALTHGRAFPELGRRGLRISAISGVDHRAVGHPRQIAGCPGLSTARRAVPRERARLRFGRVGECGAHRKTITRDHRGVRLRGGEDARRRDGPGRRDFGRPRARRARGVGPRRAADG